jgi:hypothetical protein
MEESYHFLFSCYCNFLPSAQFKVRKLNGGPDPKKPSLIFPVFISNNKVVDKKINEQLQEEILSTTTTKTPEKKIFDEIKFIESNDSVGQSGYTDMSYTIEINNANILSIFFEIESMGAYPEYYKEYFCFDSKSGELLTARTLFTEEGLSEIKKILIEERSKKIKERISEIKADDEKQFAEDSVFIFETFTECNEEANEKDFFISKENIIFYKEDCFPHAWRSYGAGLDIVFSNNEVEKYLSDHGKRILFTK